MSASVTYQWDDDTSCQHFRDRSEAKRRQGEQLRREEKETGMQCGPRRSTCPSWSAASSQLWPPTGPWPENSGLGLTVCLNISFPCLHILTFFLKMPPGISE